MRVEWDERKRRNNLEKHGLDFFEVIEVFEVCMLWSLQSIKAKKRDFLL